MAEPPDYDTMGAAQRAATEWIRTLLPEQRIVDMRFGMHDTGRFYWTAKVQFGVMNGCPDLPDATPAALDRENLAQLATAWSAANLGCKLLCAL